MLFRSFQFSDTLLGRLAREPGIVAIKNNPGPPGDLAGHFAARRALFPPPFSVGISGDWAVTGALLHGADVWYSVLGGILPKICMRIVTAARQGNGGEAQRLNGLLEPMWALFRQFSGLRVVYALADLLGLTCWS